jgi:hypothetical protein
MTSLYRVSRACTQAKSSAPALTTIAEPAFSKTVPADLTDERLETIAKNIETTHANAVLYIAAQLAEARDIFHYRRDEGGFGGWVETRLHSSRSTAYNLLSIHERFGGEKNLSKRLDTFSTSILYLLAAPSTPESACDEIIERAQAGEPVSVAEVKRVIDTAKGKRADNAKAKAVVEATVAEPEAAEKGKTPRAELPSSMSDRSSMWAHLRDALDHLNSLPRACDVAPEVAKLGKVGKIIDDRLSSAVQWLREFQTEWNCMRGIGPENGAEATKVKDSVGEFKTLRACIEELENENRRLKAELQQRPAKADAA